jgi:hypothetical protein
LVRLQPDEETITLACVSIVGDSLTHHDRFESLLRVRLNYELFVLAQISHSLQIFKVGKALAESFRLSIETDQLPDDDGKELVSTVGVVLDVDVRVVR